MKSVLQIIESTGVSLESMVEAEPGVIPADTLSQSVPIEVVVDPTVTEAIVLDQAIDSTQNEQQIIQDKADELLELQRSMESYTVLIKEAGLKGITQETARAIQIHLKSIQSKLGIETKIGSMESIQAKGYREQHDLGTIALEDIRTATKSSCAKFLAIIEKIIDLFKKLGYQLFDGIASVEKEATRLETALGNTKATGGEGEFTIDNANFLIQGDEVVRQVGADIKGLVHFSSVGYPDAVVKFFDQLCKAVLKFDPDGNTDIETFLNEYSKPLSFLIEQKLTDDILPGGYVLDVSDSGLAVGVKVKETHSESKKVPVEPTVELRKLVRDIKLLVTQMKEIRPESDKIHKAGKKLIEAAKRAAEKASEEHAETYSKMTNQVAQLVKDASPRVGEIITYLIKYCRFQLATVNHQLEIINKPTEE